MVEACDNVFSMYSSAEMKKSNCMLLVTVIDSKYAI